MIYEVSRQSGVLLFNPLHRDYEVNLVSDSWQHRFNIEIGSL